MKAINWITGLTLIIVIFSGIAIEWQFDKDFIKLYNDGNLIAKEKWVVHAERTYIVKDSWYDTNVKCPKIIEQGGHETATRCYYVDGHYEQLKRSLIKTKIELADVNFNVFVTKSTPHYKYGTRGSYAGYVVEEMTFDKRVTDEENFPEQYLVNWNPKDTRNYVLEWRVESLDDVNLADGVYYHCSYRFGNVKIDLKDECSKLNYVEISDNSKASFFFHQVKGEQDLNLKFVDPLWIYNDGEADDSLVLYLNMDGNALDTSGKGNDGTVNGASIVAGKEKLGYSFDGVDDYVDIGNNIDLTNKSVSIFAWLKPTDITGSNYPHLFSQNGNAQGIRFIYDYASIGNKGNSIYVVLNISGNRKDCGITSNILEDSWNFLGFTYNGTNVVIYSYREGLEIKNCNYTGNLNIDNYNFVIGANQEGTTYFANGTIDEVRVYNRSLTADEVLELYNQSTRSHSFEIYAINATANSSHSFEIYAINATANSSHSFNIYGSSGAI